MNCGYCGKVLTNKYTFSLGIFGVRRVFGCSRPECLRLRKTTSFERIRTKAEIREMFEALKQQRDESESLSYARTVTNLYARALAWVLKDPQVEHLLLPEEAKRLYESVS